MAYVDTSYAKNLKTPGARERPWKYGRCTDDARLRQSGVEASALLLSLVLSAALLAEAIASPSYPWFGWITPLPLLVAVRLMPPRAGFACGAFWGSSLFVFLASRIDASIPQTFQSLALLSVVPAVYACFASRLTRRYGFASSALMLGFVWAIVEIALTPLGLDGGLLGGTHGQADASLVHFFEGVLGYVFIGALITTCNGLLLSVLTRVCVGACATRRHVHGSIKAQPRFFPQEVAVHPFFFSSPAQPRAPPA